MEYKDYVIGIDIGGTNIRIGMVDKEGELYNFIIQSSSFLSNPNTSVSMLKKYINDYISKYSIGKLLAIAIGFPSTISKDKKIVYSTPNLTGFNNINIVDNFENDFKVPVFIDKDVNYLLKWDIRNKKINDKEIIIGFYIGTGYGNAICINGNFLSGKNGVAGELGHIPVLGGKDICGCGNEGCMEIYASGKKLSQIKDKYFPKTEISNIFLEHADSKYIKKFIDNISIPVATEVNIFDPDVIIVGGGVLQMKGFPFDEFERCLYRHLRKPYPAENIEILYSEQNQISGILGAAYCAHESIGSIL
ncbi:allose kinase [Caloramator sp. E03]|uniref:allose kinase n=1 Tax=Caloramator sp. E03 TaxID=2576307 RepID=UPI0011109958|nr:allose kinase [Caloramator sp. E03]QCX34030.1 allose kinase [Caloramator sp. E03]